MPQRHVSLGQQRPEATAGRAARAQSRAVPHRQESMYARAGEATEGSGLSYAEAEAWIAGVAARAALDEGRDAKGDRVRTHVQAACEQRHQSAVKPSCDLGDHHRGREQDHDERSRQRGPQPRIRRSAYSLDILQKKSKRAGARR